MATEEVLTVFLASPGHVTPERDIVRRIVEGYNHHWPAKLHRKYLRKYLHEQRLHEQHQQTVS